MDKSQKREPKPQKKNEILSLATFLTKSPIYVPSYDSDYSESLISLLPTELVQIMTVTLTHRMQKAFPQVD